MSWMTYRARLIGFAVIAFVGLSSFSAFGQMDERAQALYERTTSAYLNRIAFLFLIMYIRSERKLHSKFSSIHEPDHCHTG